MRLMHLMPAALSAGLLFAVPAHAQAARNYDCTKAGNANKTVCKQQAAAAKAVAPAPMTTTARHYDCTKAGNANKAVCKGVATIKTTTTAAPMTPAAPMAPKPAARATSATRSVSTHTVSTSTTKATNTNAAGPNGATAICNDGTYSHSAHHSGTCSGHKGVKQFY